MNLELPTTEQLRILLKGLLQCEKKTGLVAGESYCHPNGFMKIVLAKQLDGTVLRLHRWLGLESSSNMDARENIHSHRWCFRSRIICGEIAVEEYEETAGGELYVNKYACSANLRGSYEIAFSGTIYLRLRHRRIVSDGECYFTDLGMIHRVSSCLAGTATLVLHSPAMSATSAIYKMPRDGAPLELKPIMLGEEEVRRNINWLLDTIGRS